MLYTPNTLVVAYPNGNTTALIINPTDKLLEKNKIVLQEEIRQYYPNVEQCGFVFQYLGRQPKIGRLEMFGGEFCGNAARSAIKALQTWNVQVGTIEVSGTGKPLSFSIQSDNKIKLLMPLPANQKAIIKKVDIGFIVMLEGISHLVITDISFIEIAPKDSEDFKVWAKNLLSDYDLIYEPAAGCSLLFPDNSARFGVWVRDIKTVFDETACGSGTCSIGIIKALENSAQQTWQIRQPSNEYISVGFDVDKFGKKKWWIEGPVQLLFIGSLANIVKIL